MRYYGQLGYIRLVYDFLRQRRLHKAEDLLDHLENTSPSERANDGFSQWPGRHHGFGYDDTPW